MSEVPEEKLVQDITDLSYILEYIYPETATTTSKKLKDFDKIYSESINFT